MHQYQTPISAPIQPEAIFFAQVTNLFPELTNVAEVNRCYVFGIFADQLGFGQTKQFAELRVHINIAEFGIEQDPDWFTRFLAFAFWLSLCSAMGPRQKHEAE